MAEMTLNTQLSGAEVIEAVLDRLREKMRKDCNLNPNSAYDWFSAEITVKLDMHDTGVMVKGDFAAEVELGSIPPDTEVDRVEEMLTIAAAAPNTVRQETGQGIPVLTKDEEGRKVVKKVSYARRGTFVAAKVLLLAALGGAAFGQKPVLSETEKVALSSIAEHQDQIRKQEQATLEALRRVEAEIAKAHPGWHFDEASGQMLADARPDTKPDAKPGK